MITPERAPVRPRVKRKGGDATFLLEVEISELAQAGRCGMVVLHGSPGYGKSTSLKHLAAVLPIDNKVTLLDSSGSEDDLSEMDVVLLTTDKLVVTTLPVPSTYAAVEFELLPWTQDEWIEYLLACHPAQCKSVMARLLTGDENRSASYSAEIWRVILDEMAADETVSSPLDAMICRLSRLLTPVQQQALSELALKALPLPDDMTPAQGNEDLARLDKATWRLLRQPSAFHWIAAAYAVRILKLGLPQEDARCLENISELPRGYLYNLAALVRGDQEATSHLYRVFQSPAVDCHATAISVLHLAGALTPPAGSTNSPAYRNSFAGAILEGVHWPNVALRRINLRGVDFSSADLSGADLSSSHAERADFSQADLSRASLRATRLDSATLANANLSRATAHSAHLTGADCSNAVFNDADLYDSTWLNADLTDASFHRANLSQAVLRQATIDGADFTFANLWRAALDGLNLAAAQFEQARFADATLVGCTLDGVELPGVHCPGANFTNATFTGASMPGANLFAANLRGCGLADVDWEGADLRYADLRGAVFSMGGSRSGLVGSPYPGHGTRTGFYTDDFNDLSTHKHPEEIRKANLCGVDLRGANIEGVDFYLVDLRGARYDREQAEQLRRCGAILREPVA